MCEVWLLISVQSGKENFSIRKDFENNLSLRQQWENNYMPLSLFLALVLSPFPLFLFSLSFLASHQSLSLNLPFLSSFHSAFFFPTFKENNIQTKIESLVMMEKFCRHKPMQVLLFPLTYLSSKNYSFTKNCFFLPW